VFRIRVRVGTIDWSSIIDGVILYFYLIEYRFVSTFLSSNIDLSLLYHLDFQPWLELGLMEIHLFGQRILEQTQ